MGTIQKTARISGRTLQVAYEKLRQADREENGDDIYSGGWWNSTGVREVSPEEYNKKYDEITKHEPAMARCTVKPIGNTNKIKTEVTNYPVKGTRKWVTKYVAVSWKDGYEKTVVSEDTQTEAIKKARAFVEKFPEEKLSVEITKVLEGGKSTVAEIKYKKATNERDGQWEIRGAMSY